MRKLLAGAVLVLALAGCASVSEPPLPTDAELATYIREQQDQLWYEYGSPQFERPTVESVLVAPHTFNDPDNRCSAGAASTIISGEAVILQTSWEIPATAQYLCHAAIIPYPTDVEYYTSAQLGAIYDHFRDSLVPCLQVQGLSVGVAPSRDEFVGVAGAIPWDPYTELGADLPPSRAAQIHARCAALPDAEFLAP